MDQLPERSIDDNLIDQSLSLTRLQDNLSQLQKYVIDGYSKMTQVPYTVKMEPYTSNHCLPLTNRNREDSVADDELFGEGSNCSMTGPQSSFEIPEESASGQNLAAIPCFSLLNSIPNASNDSVGLIQSVGSGQASVEYPNRSVDSIPSGVTKTTSADECSFKDVFQKERSLSAIELRKLYSRGVDEEVFEGENAMSDRKKNSRELPDVILMSSGSQSSNSFPDVTDNSPDHHSVEKPSDCSIELPNETNDNSVVYRRSNDHSIELPNAANDNTVVYRSKGKMAVRSVSINENANQYIGDDSERNIEEERERNSSVSSEEQKNRQDRWSKSSGYGTGDSEIDCQDKQYKSQTSSEAWVSGDSAAEDEPEVFVDNSKFYDSVVGAVGNMVNFEQLLESLQSLGCEEAYKSLTEGSQGSLVSEQSEYDSKDGLSVKSDNTFIESGNSQDTNYYNSHRTYDNGSIYSSGMGQNRSADGGACGGAACGVGVSSDCHEILKLKSNDTYGHTYIQQPKSAGNMPTIVTEDSFSIKPAEVQILQNELTQDYRRVLAGQPLQTESLSPEIPLSQETQNYLNHWHKLKEQEFEILLNNMSPTEVLVALSSISPPEDQARRYRLVRKDQLFEEFTIEDLLQSSRCRLPQCPEICCRKMSVIDEVLNMDLPVTHHAYRLVVQYCRLLFSHHIECDDEFMCTVKYCGDKIKAWGIKDVEDDHQLAKQMVSRIQRSANNPLMSVFIKDSCTFHPLDSTVGMVEPKEFSTHTPMFSMGRFGTATVCMDQQLCKLCLIKTFPLLDYDHHKSLYKCCLQNKSHPNIVQHLWMMEYSDTIQVCTLFMAGGSLQDTLRNKGALSWQLAKHYLLQIIQAVLYLHSINIVYLNWQSKNMLFESSNRYVIKLSNFGLSCPTDCEADLGAIKQCLPVYLCTPELLRYNIDYHCDTWGAGCLLHEMLTTEPILHEYRHKPRDDVFEHITKRSLLIPTVSDDLTRVFEMCWQKSPGERWTLLELYRRLQAIPDNSR